MGHSERVPECRAPRAAPAWGRFVGAGGWLDTGRATRVAVGRNRARPVSECSRGNGAVPRLSRLLPTFVPAVPACPDCFRRVGTGDSLLKTGPLGQTLGAVSHTRARKENFFIFIFKMSGQSGQSGQANGIMRLAVPTLPKQSGQAGTG